MRNPGDPCEFCGTTDDKDTARHLDGCPVKVYRQSGGGDAAGHAQDNWDNGRWDGCCDAPPRSSNASYLLGHSIGKAEFNAELDKLIDRKTASENRMVVLRHLAEQCTSVIN